MDAQQYTYRHKKTGGHYAVMASNAVMEADLSPVVVYEGHTECPVASKNPGPWVRPKAEFEDGRFEKVAVTFVGKLQKPLAGDTTYWMLYGENKSHLTMVEPGKLPKEVRKIVNRDLKAYFDVMIVSRDTEVMEEGLYFLGLADDEGW